jgi:hypothetical protein
MPTSLPLVYSTDIIDRDKSSHGLDAVWIIAIWGIVMLACGALANFGGDPGTMGPFQLLAAF